MLKEIFGRIGHDEAPTQPSAQTVDPERLKTLVEFFSIGRKLRYYPEFKKDIVFDTLIVGYCVNGEFVYSIDAIDFDAKAHPVAFRAGDNGRRIATANIRLFQLLVPDTTDLEMQLDYVRRAELGRGKQFNKGNYISLISNAGVRGMSTLDTEVVKAMDMATGPYAQSRMILLTPEFSTLVVTDQRRKPRAKTCAPVVLCLPEGKLSGSCVIADISDALVRVRISDKAKPLPPLAAGAELTLDVDLGESGGRRYLLKGRVVRGASDACVIRLEGLVESGRVNGFGPLDLLELKAGLLNYGS